MFSAGAVSCLIKSGSSGAEDANKNYPAWVELPMSQRVFLRISPSMQLML